MAINVNVFDYKSNSSRSITVEFEGNLLATSDSLSDEPKYFLKFSTNARGENNEQLPAKIVQSFEDLALNETNQRINGSTNSYTTIKELVTDYVYDYVNGHEEDLYGSGVKEQSKIRF